MTAPLVIQTIYFLVLLALAGWSTWRAADRARDYFVIVFLAIALLPLLATTLTGDVSRFLPAASFADGMRGKDQIIMASVVTTLLVATTLASLLTLAIKLCWRKLRADKTTPR